MTDNKTATDKIRETAAETGAAAKKAASDAAMAAKDEAVTRADAAKDGVAGEMKSTADALRHAANDVRDGSPQGAAFSYLADSLAEVADSVKDRSVTDMVGEVSSFARRNPIAFLGGAALLGFAATRFAKAQTPVASPAYHAPQASAAQAPKPSAHSTAYNPNIPQMENRDV